MSAPNRGHSEAPQSAVIERWIGPLSRLGEAFRQIAREQLGLLQASPVSTKVTLRRR